MSFAWNPLALPSLAGALLMVAVVAFALARRNAPSTLRFALLCSAAAVWCAGHALEYSSTTVEGRVFWGKLQYLGSQTVPLFWFTFALAFSGRPRWMRWWQLAILAIVPALTIILVLAYPFSQLVWVSFSQSTDGAFLVSSVVRGPMFWVSVVYGYSLVLGGIVLIASVALRSSSVYRHQAIALLAGAVIPLLGNALFVSGFSPVRMDITPASFALACLVFAFALFRFHLFDLAPIARETVVDGMADAVIVLDHRGRIVDANLAAQRLAGRPLKYLLGHQASERLPHWPAIAGGVHGPQTSRTEIVLAPESGRAHELRVSRIQNRQHELAGTIIVLRDVTDRRRTESALQRANGELSERIVELERRNLEITLLADLGECLLSSNAEAELVRIVAGWGPQLFADGAGLLAFRRGDELVVTASWGASPEPGVILQGNDERSPWGISPDQVVIPLLEGGTQIGLFAVRLGARAAHSDSARRVLAAAADLIGLALANLRMRERLHDESIRDALTGLFNRRHLDIAIEQEIQRAMRSGDCLAVLMLDLDHFKQFNDRFGHAAGDSVLRTLGGFLASRLRATDIACRYGGEEFTILLPGTAIEQTRQIAERLRGEFAETRIVHAGDTLPSITISIGIAAYPYSGRTAAEVLNVADRALYRAKAGGRDRVVIADPFPYIALHGERVLPAAS